VIERLLALDRSLNVLDPAQLLHLPLELLSILTFRNGTKRLEQWTPGIGRKTPTDLFGGAGSSFIAQKLQLGVYIWLRNPGSIGQRRLISGHIA
jgi:hypothetical protein